MDIRALFNQLLSFFDKLNKKQKIVMLSSVVALVAFISYLVVFSAYSDTNKDGNYAVLFDNISSSDSALIIQHLKNNNIPYKIPKEDTILVPKDVVYEQRIALSSSGIPKDSKVGYEIFDTQNIGTTEFENQIKLVRALEGELSKTIQSLQPIDKASVQLAIPKESLFVSNEVLPTASVVLQIKPNMYLSPTQIDGIKNLVSASVPKLTKENVTIVDQNGEMLGSDSEHAVTNERLNTEFKYKNNYERNLEDKILNVLSPVVGGKDRVVAKVNAEFDFSQKKSTSEVYDPNNVVRSEQNLEEKREGGKDPEIGGVPGAISNVGPTQGLDSINNKEIYSKNVNTTNYEVSKTVSEIKGEFGTLKRLSAAVVVDGKYEIVNTDGVEKMQFVAFDEDKMKQIDSLVKQAIGYSQSRGDEVSVSNFELNQKTDAYKPQTTMDKMLAILSPLLPLMKYIIVAIIIFIFYQKIISPFVQRMLDVEKSDDVDAESLITIDDEEETDNRLNELKRKAEAQLASGVNEDEIKYDVLLSKIKELIEEKPEEVATLFQTLVHDELGIEEMKKGD